MKKGRAMQEKKELLNMLVIFAVVLLCFCAVATACPPPECPDCRIWNGNRCVWDCSYGQSCCDDACYNPSTQKCCDPPGDDNGYPCPKSNTCCSGGCCDPVLCESCIDDWCQVCGGDTNKGCCDGQCYNKTTQKCCDGLGPLDIDYICDIDETCCDGLCVDTTIDQCCDDLGGYNDGYNCDKDCELCCDGTCCDVSNCEICKNDTCVRAVPTNMHQTYVEDMGDGVLYFEYDWESTTGDLADLGNCRVGEKVDYQGGGNPYCFPSPPWAAGTCRDNPYFSSHLATSGGFGDIHTPGSFTKPYQVDSVTATQVYQYHCGPDCCMGDRSDRGNLGKHY